MQMQPCEGTTWQREQSGSDFHRGIFQMLTYLADVIGKTQMERYCNSVQKQ